MTRMQRAAVAAAAIGAMATGAAAPAAQAADQQAYAAGLTYVTPAVVASRGDTVTFDNLDPLARHNLVSDTPGLFASDLIGQNETAPVVGVDKLAAGTYAFHCTLHAWMHGAIQVVDASSPPAPPPVTPPSPGDAPNPVDLLPKAPPAKLTKGEWPLYGHDLANSRDGGTAGPGVADVPFLRPVWSFKSSDGDFTGTPVEAGGRVVAVSGGGTVFALDGSTGRKLWSRDLDQVANGTAAISGGRVFVPLSKANGPKLAALSLADGRLLWETTFDHQKGADVFGSPTMWNG